MDGASGMMMQQGYNPFGLYTRDNQDPLGFLISQLAYVEQQVYEVRYPDIQYPGLVPVDTGANEWARTITYFSMDKVGQATWFNHMAKDIPHAESFRTKHDVTVEMAAIGYGYSNEELGQAMMVPGQSLTTDRAMAARRAAEEFIDDLVLNGDSDKGWDGLLNHSSVTKSDAPDGASGSGNTEWNLKTGDEIIKDVNTLLGGMYEDTKTVELADTLLLPPSAYAHIAGTPRSTHSDVTVMKFIMESNIYTATTGMPLMIRVCRGLENAAASNHGRAIAYRRHPEVLKLHMPMPHRFLPVYQSGPISYEVPGILRLGGLEIRRPKAIRYLDLITT